MSGLIGLVRTALVAVPATLWYAGLVLWLAFRRVPDLTCRCDEIPRNWARVLMKAAGARVELEGDVAIDPDRAHVLVSNHVSWFDVLALAGWFPGRYRFVGKRELNRIPIFGAAWEACGHISIDRHDRSSAIESLSRARELLERDRPTVIFFPEGTRSPTGELRAFKKGAFVLALQTGVDVIPVAILGSRKIMAKGSWKIHTGRTIRVRFGAPLSVEGLGVQDRDTLTQRGHDAVAALLEEGRERLQGRQESRETQ